MEWSPRSLENSLTALEHLRAFANPLGVKLLVENIQNEVTQPRNLLEILNVGHFKDIGVCLDTGHAHLGDGVATTISELRPLIRSSHLHDNNGDRDDHLWPGDGTIAWDEAIGELNVGATDACRGAGDSLRPGRNTGERGQQGPGCV